jgi:hypothetical protein
VRNEVFYFVRMLASRQYSELAESYQLTALFETPESVKYPDMEMEKVMVPYYESRKWIRLDPAARALENTRIEESDDRKSWTVRQTLVDSEELNDWELVFGVDLESSRSEGELVLSVLGLGPINEKLSF